MSIGTVAFRSAPPIGGLLVKPMLVLRGRKRSSFELQSPVILRSRFQTRQPGAQVGQPCRRPYLVAVLLRVAVLKRWA